MNRSIFLRTGVDVGVTIGSQAKVALHTTTLVAIGGERAAYGQYLQEEHAFHH